MLDIIIVIDHSFINSFVISIINIAVLHIFPEHLISARLWAVCWEHIDNNVPFAFPELAYSLETFF